MSPTPIGAATYSDNLQQPFIFDIITVPVSLETKVAASTLLTLTSFWLKL